MSRAVPHFTVRRDGTVVQNADLSGTSCVSGHDLVDVTPPGEVGRVRVFGCARCRRGMPPQPPIAAETVPSMSRTAATVLALAGGLAMLAGLLLAVWVAIPMNGHHLTAVLLVGGGGIAWVRGVCALADHLLPEEDR